MKLKTEPYLSQRGRWPKMGQHILAQFDNRAIVVYQAYRLAIGRFATDHGYFGGEFSLGRMSWIKTNFLWMMYRSGWGTKPDQEITLAVRMKREAFDEILAAAVSSSFSPGDGDEDAWKRTVKTSDVRLQWDPDDDPLGSPLERRAVQLGLRGDLLRKYAREWIIEIEDISDFVAEQREFAKGKCEGLLTPVENIYPEKPRS